MKVLDELEARILRFQIIGFRFGNAILIQISKIRRFKWGLGAVASDDGVTTVTIFCNVVYTSAVHLQNWDT